MNLPSLSQKCMKKLNLFDEFDRNESINILEVYKKLIEYIEENHPFVYEKKWKEFKKRLILYINRVMNHLWITHNLSKLYITYGSLERIAIGFTPLKPGYTFHRVRWRIEASKIKVPCYETCWQTIITKKKDLRVRIEFLWRW